MTDSIKTSDKQFTKSESSKEKPNNKLFSEGEEYAEDRYTVEDEEIVFIKGTPFNLRKKDGKRLILIGVELASGKVFDDIESANNRIRRSRRQRTTLQRNSRTNRLTGNKSDIGQYDEIKVRNGRTTDNNIQKRQVQQLVKYDMDK